MGGSFLHAGARNFAGVGFLAPPSGYGPDLNARDSNNMLPEKAINSLKMAWFGKKMACFEHTFVTVFSSPSKTENPVNTKRVSWHFM